MTELLLLLALAPSMLLAYTLSPSATVLNQLVALGGWGLAVGVLGARRALPPLRGFAALGLCGLAYIAMAVIATVFQGVPVGIASSTALTIAAGLVVALFGYTAGREGDGRVLQAMWIALAVVGCADLVIALMQVFTPDLPDGDIIARSGLVGRAVGNLRQPNHLSSVALWSTVALVPLVESRRLDWRLGAVLFALFVFSVELSASRTGMVGVGVLAAWGVADARLSRRSRAMLLAAPVIYGIGWVGMSLWADVGHHVFGAAQRLGESDISGSRYGIWSNSLHLIGQFWLTGVGFGDFNFAWTLTPFPGRPTAFFDHTHNIVLQLLVELGLPIGLLVVAGLACALWQGFSRSWLHRAANDAGARAAFVMVLMMVLHSQLEYPLWYAYFLLPTAFAWGWTLAEGDAGAGRLRGTFAVAGLALVVGAGWAWSQYATVSLIFEPTKGDERTLDERIAAGRATVFYAHHADYAAVTVTEHPAQAWDSFRTAPHYLLDTRLMIAWADAFAERGDLDHARYIAQRLREFDKTDAAEYFAPCDKQPRPDPLPYQCTPPARAIDWREFRSPSLWEPKR